MKNLPEHRMWDKIKSRLRNYEEEPDDDWNAIVAGVNAQSQSSADFATRSLRVILVLLLVWLAVPENPGGEQPGYGISGRAAHASAQISKLTIDNAPDNLSVKDETEENEHHGGVRASDQSALARVDEINAPAKFFKRLPARRDGLDYIALKGESADADVQNQSDKNRGEESILKTVSSEKLEHLSVALAKEQGSSDLPATYEMRNPVPAVDSISITPEVVVKEVAKTEEKKQVKRKRKPLLIYGSITPSLAYYSITPDKKDDLQLKELKSPGIFASDRLGFSIDFGLHRQLTRNIEGYAGVSYYQQQQGITYSYFSSEVSGISSKDGLNYEVTPGTETTRTRYTMKNIGLSAGVFYTLKRATLNHQVGAGLQYHYGLSRVAGETAIRNDAMSYLNYQIMYRLRWNVTSRLDLYLQPSYTSSFAAQRNDLQPFSVKPSRAGIGFGFIYFLR
jgi:hypothetical protein